MFKSILIHFALFQLTISGLFAQSDKARIGKPLPPLAKPTPNADTIKATKIGNYVLLPLPKENKAASSVVVKPNVTTTTPSNVPTAYGTPPPVQVSIRLMENKVSRLNDVIVYITLTNKGRSSYDYQFDRPYRPGYGPWYTDCYLKRNGQNIAKVTNRGTTDPTKYSREQLVAQKSTLLPRNWIMKGYPLKQLVVLDEDIEKSGRLPSGFYELQISYMGVLSNSVTLQIR